MSQFYNLTSFTLAGDPWSSAHGTFQSYWGTFDGVQGNAMFSKKVGSAPTPGQVFGDMVIATSQNGNQYYKFKSAQVPPGTVRPANALPALGVPAAPASPAYTPAAAPAPLPNMSAEMPAWFVPFAKILVDLSKWAKEMAGEDVPASQTALPVEPMLTPVDELRTDNQLSPDQLQAVADMFPE